MNQKMHVHFYFCADVKAEKDLEKQKKNFVILGAYDDVEKMALDKNQFLVIAKLPSREILLAQLVGVLSGPIRAFMYIADQLSKKSAVAESVLSADKPAPSANEAVADNAKTVENNQQTQ